jgi:hypothetical protein
VAAAAGSVGLNEGGREEEGRVSRSWSFRFWAIEAGGNVGWKSVWIRTDREMN